MFQRTCAVIGACRGGTPDVSAPATVASAGGRATPARGRPRAAEQYRSRPRARWAPPDPGSRAPRPARAAPAGDRTRDRTSDPTTRSSARRAAPGRRRQAAVAAVESRGKRPGPRVRRVRRVRSRRRRRRSPAGVRRLFEPNEPPIGKAVVMRRCRRTERRDAERCAPCDAWNRAAVDGERRPEASGGRASALAPFVRRMGPAEVPRRGHLGRGGDIPPPCATPGPARGTRIRPRRTSGAGPCSGDPRPVRARHRTRARPGAG